MPIAGMKKAPASTMGASAPVESRDANPDRCIRSDLRNMRLLFIPVNGSRVGCNMHRERPETASHRALRQQRRPFKNHFRPPFFSIDRNGRRNCRWAARAGGAGSANCLDAAGNRKVEQVKDPSNVLKRSLSRTYNTLSQLTQVQNHAGVSVERSDTLTISGQPIADGYDGNGNRVLVQDGFGTQTRQAFDGLNRLIDTYQDDLGASTATVDTHTHYLYDTRDNLRQVTDPDGLNTVYTYDGLNNLTGLSSPDTGSTAYTVDKAGNRLTQTDNRGITSTYTYDALNRLTAIAYPTTTLNVTYAYDQANATTGCTTSYPLGRLTTMTDGSGSTTYCYDRRGNVTQKKQVTSGVTLTTQYGYTLADRLANITYPSGAIVTYTRDTVGRVKTVTWKANATSSATTLVSNATYYPFGPLNVLTFGNGRTLTKTYDQDYAIDGIASSISTGLQLDFGVDVMGNVQAASVPASGGGSSLIVPSGGTATVHLYSYDPLYHLTQASIQLTTGFQEAYTYNKTGDRLSSALNNATPTPYTYTAGTHHLASVGSTARTYDANGNTKTGIAATMTFGYDDKNRLATATNAFVTATYTTNGRGERVRKVVTGVNPVTADYSYDEGGQLLGEYSATGTAQAEYIYLDSTPIAVAKGTALAYVETDHLGTPRQVVDPATNNAMWTWDGLASAFGVNAPNQSPSGGAAYTFNLRFPGQYYDAETGLNYNYFRDYEPATGRYIESDPISLRGGISTYAYASSRPLSRRDKRGLLSYSPGLGGSTTQSLQDGEQKLEYLLTTSCDCGQGDSCFPCELKNEMLNKLRTSNIYYSMVSWLSFDDEATPTCAFTQINGSSTGITTLGLMDPQCDCLPSLLLHEIMHQVGVDHTGGRRDPNDPVYSTVKKCNICNGKKFPWQEIGY